MNIPPNAKPMDVVGNSFDHSTMPLLNRKRLLIFSGYFLSIAVLTLMFYNPVRRNNEIQKHLTYSVATVYKMTGSLKNASHYHYKFLYNGKEYESYNSTNRNYIVSFGQRFLVEFSDQAPEIARIRYDKPVPDSLKKPPLSGWRQAPF